MLSSTHITTGLRATVAASRSHAACPEAEVAVPSYAPAHLRPWATDANTAAGRVSMATFVSIDHKLGRQRLEEHST